jgi:hypothetical protein
LSPGTTTRVARRPSLRVTLAEAVADQAVKIQRRRTAQAQAVVARAVQGLHSPSPALKRARLQLSGACSRSGGPFSGEREELGELAVSSTGVRQLKANHAARTSTESSTLGCLLARVAPLVARSGRKLAEDEHRARGGPERGQAVRCLALACEKGAREGKRPRRRAGALPITTTVALGLGGWQGPRRAPHARLARGASQRTSASEPDRGSIR